MDTAKKNSVPALARGLRILELLPKSRGGLTLSQLTRHLQLPKSSVHCLLHTLQDSGYVHRDPATGKYRVALRVCVLAQMALNGIGLREQAKPHLRRLAEVTGLTSHLAVMEQGATVLIEKVSAPDVMRISTWIGKRCSLHCTALGKALAAYLPEEQVEALVREQGLLRHNDNTICSSRRLKQELATVRERGYALDDEEEEINVRCIGAPIFDSHHRAIAAVSIAGSTSEVQEGNLRQLANQVIGTAAAISEQVKDDTDETQGAALTWPFQIGPVMSRDSKNQAIVQ